MANVKINQKNYVVPILNFSDMVVMEDMGFSVIELFQKQKIFSLATAFVGVVAKCTRPESEELCQQHVMGGGDIADIYDAFIEAANESAFFKKLLGKPEKNAPTKKASTKKSEPAKE